jgi:hypothetical protein
MAVSGHVHPPAALLPGKEALVPIGWEAGWAPEPVWTLWRRKISCPCRESNLGREPIARRNTELERHNLYSPPTIILVIKWRRIRWVVHVACMGIWKMHTASENVEGRALWRPRHRCEYNSIYFIFRSFNDAINNSDYAASNDPMIVNNKLELIWNVLSNF